MSPPTARWIENDVAPERETLSPSQIESIRVRCSTEVEAGIARIVREAPPEAPRRRGRLGEGPTLYLGLLGQAFGFLHLHERGDGSGTLELARRYLAAAETSLERAWLPRPEEWLSFHGTGGLPAVASVVADRLGDVDESRHRLEGVHRMAARAAEPDFGSEDLLWGRGGFVYAAAFLRASLGVASVPDALVRGALEAMIERGRSTARRHAAQLTPLRHGRVPLLYLNLNAFVMGSFAKGYVPGRSALSRGLARLAGHAIVLAEARRYGLGHRYDLGLVHGVPGNLYLLMHFPQLLGEDALLDVRHTLDCVAECVDAERGVLELLPSPHSDALHRRTGSPAYTERVHWCSGSPAMVFLFARAHEVFGDAAYLETARRAAEHVWRYGLLRKGNGICHGVAGNGYAFLSLHRRTGDPRDLHRALHFARHSWSERVLRAQRTPDRPWSLYEGLMGTLCFYRDCLEPERARFPAFEV